MKIAILVGDITRMYGTERAVTNLANLSKKYLDHDIYIVSFCKSKDRPAYLLDAGVNVEYLGYKDLSSIKISARLYTYLFFMFRIRRFVKANNINIVIGTQHAINFMLPLITLGGHIKTIGCEHTSYFAIPRYSRFVRSVLYRFLSKVVVLTNADKIAFSHKIKSIDVVPNSNSFYPDVCANLNIKRIIAIGRLDKQKGFDILIPLCVDIFRQHTDWKLSIYGSGSDYEILSELIINNNLQNYIEILPPISNIVAELLNSSIFVFPSLLEGFPMALIEAMACGLPPVSFDCPNGPADLITNNTNGFLLAPEDIDGFKNGILKLIDSYELRTRFGSASRESVSILSPENISKKWEKVFNNLINKELR